MCCANPRCVRPVGVRATRRTGGLCWSTHRLQRACGDAETLHVGLVENAVGEAERVRRLDRLRRPEACLEVELRPRLTREHGDAADPAKNGITHSIATTRHTSARRNAMSCCTSASVVGSSMSTTVAWPWWLLENLTHGKPTMQKSGREG
jgi:hypothetical protein